MDKKEFEVSKEMIQSIVSKNKDTVSGLTAQLEKLITNIKDYQAAIDKRDNAFIKYIDMLEDFTYSDLLSSPIDLFPGIKTAVQQADPEELQAKTDEMKDAAYHVKAEAEQASDLMATVSQEIRTYFSAIQEFSISENKVYDLCMDLISKSDSIYDVGNIGN